MSAVLGASGGVRFSTRAGVASIRIPRRIGPIAAQAIADAAEEIEFDDAVAVVLLRGERDAFCLGVDGSDDAAEWRERIDWIAAIGRLTRPVICALGGDAVAEGCELALACDLRIASARAGFQLPQIREGRVPTGGATQRLPRLIGRSRALELLLSGRRVGAREAAAMGLVNQVAAPGRFDALVREVVGELSDKAPLALRLAKEAVLHGAEMTFDQGVRLEQDLYVLLQTTRDRAEGVRAFLGRRKPRFRGR